MLSFDGDPRVEVESCASCGDEHQTVTGFVLQDGTAYAVYFADWHPRRSEAYIDVTFGSFEAPGYADHVTFGCRVGPVPSQAAPACSLVAAAVTRPDQPILGRKLDRDGALAHPRLGEFWTVVDWLIVNDPVLHECVFHMPGNEP